MSGGVLSPSLKASIEQAAKEIPAGQKGHAYTGVSLTGVETGIAQRGPWGILTAGYARRLWGGGWEAGARAWRSW